jgi:hypothetical protein
MKTAKRKRLERAGWRLASTEEFLELSEEEQALVEIKLALLDGHRAARKTSVIRGSLRGTNEIERVASDDD